MDISDPGWNSKHSVEYLVSESFQGLENIIELIRSGLVEPLLGVLEQIHVSRVLFVHPDTEPEKEVYGILLEKLLGRVQVYSISFGPGNDGENASRVLYELT